MNSKRKSRSSLFSENSTCEKKELTPKNESIKQNLFTPCRRVGLNRKKNKSSNIKNNNMFVDEDLQKINNAESSTEVLKFTSVEENKINVLEDPTTDHIENETRNNATENKIKKQRKRKLENKVEDQIKNTFENKIKINITESKIKKQRNHKADNNSDVSQDNTDSSVMSMTQTGQVESSNKETPELVNQITQTIPVSINLTRCDLNVLKLNLMSSVKNKENINYDFDNVKETSQPQKNKANVNQLNMDKNNSDKQLEILEDTVSEKTSVLKSAINILSENNSLEDNSDGSDFYPSVPRRKKKKILTNKQRSTSKPSPSIQKQSISVNKRTSTNNTPYYSDSDDDFVASPVRRERKNSVKSENNSQNSVKEENGKVAKKKIKMQKPLGCELNKTGHFRISENKSYTIIQRENSVSYVKSHDNDVNFKVTESDDNQQPPAKHRENIPKKSFIIERKDYLSKQQNDSNVDAKLISEMPSIFADIMNNLDNMAVEFSNVPTEEKHKKSGDSNNQESNNLSKSNNQQELNNEEESNNQQIDKQLKSQETDQKKSSEPEKTSDTTENDNQLGDETSESDNNVTDIENSENANSSDSSESELYASGLNNMSEEELMAELTTLKANIKKKKERLQSLERISVYKQSHDLDHLRELTLKIKRGCQNALIDLVSNVKEQSNANFTMATLLEYMKIPNELVGYNENDDNFT